MPTITMQVPETSFAALRKDPDEFVREMRIAAAVEWYAEGIVSQGKAAELGGLSRIEFLEELHRRKVPACQATLDEIREEIRGD
jgi:predicted HTH domain antitoxin